MSTAARKCHSCGKAFEGLTLCEHCGVQVVKLQAGGDVCGACDKKVFYAERKEDNGRIYHSFCYKCCQCNRPLDTHTAKYEGKFLFCSKCKADRIVAIERPAPKEKLRTERTHGLCSSCSKIIATADDLLELQQGERFHYACFKCLECKKPIKPSSKFVRRGKDFLHPPCAEKKGPMCPKCSKPAVGQLVVVGGVKMHPECFVCADCGKALKSYTLVDKVPYCMDCESKVKKGCCTIL